MRNRSTSPDAVAFHRLKRFAVAALGALSLQAEHERWD
jgi:hypothetical protein